MKLSRLPLLPGTTCINNFLYVPLKLLRVSNGPKIVIEVLLPYAYAIVDDFSNLGFRYKFLYVCSSIILIDAAVSIVSLIFVLQISSSIFGRLPDVSMDQT